MRAARKVTTPPKVSHEPAAAPADRTARVRVGAHDDPAEAHADRLAQRALDLSREYSSEAQTAAPAIRRSPARGAEPAGEMAIDSASLQRASAGGSALEPAARDRMEAGFGRDLSGVRVHTGPAAADLAAGIGARAFATGSDIYFAGGQYQPNSPSGDEVLAHEVAHTVQQGAGIHRFPDTAMSAAVPWAAQTAGVFRPGGGVSGGVYILRTSVATDRVQKAVVKPVFGKTAMGDETGEQLVASDRVLGSLLGLKAPSSRVVKAGTPEFAELVAVCSPYQPAKDPNAVNADLYKPLAQAESFVVMSEVPNADSIGGLVEKSANDNAKSADLVRTLFSPGFLHDLGKLMIGDILVGNPDRFMFGADNLGNVMVSMQNGTGELHAIDTTAYLPKAMTPSAHAIMANSRGDAKDEINWGPEYKLNRFFSVIVDQMKTHTVGNPALPLWEQLETGLLKHRKTLLARFTAGWDEGLAAAMTLAGANGEEYADMALGGMEGPNVNKEGLLANAAYLAGRAKGGTHAESLGRTTAINLTNWARSYAREALSPASDELSPQFAAPAKGVLGVDWVQPASLPPAKDLKRAVPANAAFMLTAGEQKTLQAYPGKIRSAHAEVDTALPPKKRGILRQSTPRDRNQLGHAMVTANAVIAGSGRLLNLAAKLNRESSEILAGLANAEFEGSEAAPVKQLADYFSRLPDYLQGHAARYAAILPEVQKAVSRSSYATDGEGAQVATHANTALAQLGTYQTVLDKVRNRDLRNATAHL